MTLFKESILLNSVAVSLMNEGKPAESSQALNLALGKLELCFWDPFECDDSCCDDDENESSDVAKQQVETSEESKIYTLIEERSPLYRCQNNRRTFTSVPIDQEGNIQTIDLLVFDFLLDLTMMILTT